MPPFFSRRNFLVRGLCLSMLPISTGCGTILHPERRGQCAGPLDWKIVALNGIGLLFFFLPGVIAFAVDFSNGTIYLPCDDCATEKLREVRVSRSEMSQRRVEEVVSAHAGRNVRLEPHEYTTRELKSIEEFWETRNAFGHT